VMQGGISREKTPPCAFQLPTTVKNLLAPVAFHHHPTAMAMLPAMRYPNRVRTGRTVVVARNPDIRASIPAVIPGDPYESALWRRTWPLIDGSRWADTNHNLRHCGCGRKRCCQQESQHKLLHSDFIPPFSTQCRNYIRIPAARMNALRRD